MASKRIYQPVPGPWGALLDEWHEDLLDRGRRPNTCITYPREGVRFARWAIAGGTAIADVDDDTVRAWVRLRRQNGCGSRSNAARLAALRSMFDVAVRRRFIAVNPARAVENPRFRKPLPTVLAPGQLEVLLDLPLRRPQSEITTRDAALLRLLVWAGPRASELCSLDWDDIDLTEGRATIRIVDGKGGADRVIPAVEPLAEALLRYLQYRLPLSTNRAAFISAHRNRLTPRRLNEIITRYGDRIGINIYPHMLRAQCGVSMVRAGATLPEIRAVLGHRGYDTLLPYTAVAAEEARDALERIAGRSW